MIKTINKYLLVPIFINLFINTFINTGSYISAKLLGLPSYMQVVAGEVKADNIYLVPHACSTDGLTGSGNAITTSTHVTETHYCSISTFTSEPLPINTSGDISFREVCDATVMNYSGSDLIYTYRQYIEKGGDPNEHRVYYACPTGADWNTYDTDGDGVNNGTDTEWWNPSVHSSPGSQCASSPNQLIAELGKEWNLTAQGLPDKYIDNINGDLCEFDRASVGISGFTVTATYQATGAIGGAVDKPTNFSQFVIRRCDAETLQGNSTGLNWDNLPNDICHSTGYGSCVFQTPQEGGTAGALTVTYTATDSITCDAASQINPVWDDYANLCTERQDLQYVESGDLWNNLPTTIGDGACEYNLISSPCADGFCIANYTPNGNTSSDLPPNFEQFSEEDNQPSVPFSNGDFDIIGDSQTDITSSYNSVTGRNDVCGEVINCTGTSGVCPTGAVSSNIDLLENHLTRINDLHNQTDDNIYSHIQGVMQYDSNPSTTAASFIPYDPEIQCEGYNPISEKVFNGHTGGYGDGTGNFQIDYDFKPTSITNIGQGELILNFEPPYGGNANICAQQNVIIQGGREGEITFQGYGFSNNGSCAGIDGSNTNPDGTNEGDEGSDSIVEKLDEILDQILPASDEQLADFQSQIAPPDDSEVFQELDISEGWEPYDVFGVEIPTTCSPLVINFPEVDMGLFKFEATSYSNDMTAFCDLADMLRPFLIVLALLNGLYIIRGNV